MKEINEILNFIAIAFILGIEILILAIVCDTDSKITNVQNNCISVNDETYCKSDK